MLEPPLHRNLPRLTVRDRGSRLKKSGSSPVVEDHLTRLGSSNWPSESGSVWRATTVWLHCIPAPTRAGSVFEDVISIQIGFITLNIHHTGVRAGRSNNWHALCTRSVPLARARVEVSTTSPPNSRTTSPISGPSAATTAR